MSKPKVFITRPIPEEILKEIEGKCDAEMWHTSAILPPIAEKISDLHGLMTYGHELVTAEMMGTAPNLKVIAGVGVGYDHIDAAAAKARGIAVGNTPGVLDNTTADLTFAILLAAARNIISANHHVQSKQWNYYDPNILWGHDVHHATLGIVGMGRIGYAVAKRALGFDMRVLYNRRNRQEAWEAELGVEYATLDRLLEESDFVALHVPLTDETHHLIDAAALKKMKSTAILVNVARGPVIDSKALYNALVNGEIAGAALDVTDPEPILPDDPLLTLDNVLVVPHVGSATIQTRMRMATMAKENLFAGLDGRPLPYSVFGD